MEFKQLQSYVTVVRCQSFSKAAQVLFMSQPSISTHIRSLEEEIGKPLLIRNAKTLELTEAGTHFYQYAENILQMKDRMMNFFSTEKKEIFIGASTVHAAFILPELVAAYSRKEPDVFFSIDQEDSRTIIDRISDHMYDLGFTGTRYIESDSELEYLPAFTDRMVIIVPSEAPYINEDGSDKTLEELLDLPFIIYGVGSSSGEYMYDLLEFAGRTVNDLNITARINNPEAIIRLVERGMGAACVSMAVLKDMHVEDRVKVCELPDVIAERQLYMVRKKNAAVKEHVMKFARYILQYSNSR